MLVDEQIKNARHNFILASEEFGFEFMSPFNLTDEIEVFGYISNYGSKNGAVIGAGSVVTKDIPPNVFACGVPCCVVREITEEDRLEINIYKEKPQCKNRN